MENDINEGGLDIVEPTTGNVRHEKSEIIKIIGVGGAGGNALRNLYNKNIQGVNLVICNTDQQALDDNPVAWKISLGPTITDGLGAGSNPEVGANAARDSQDEIMKVLNDNTKMVFITAGMGGGTGTGAAPVIAKMAKDMGILTVGIVSIPSKYEGQRIKLALAGVEQMNECVDSLLLINSQRIFEMEGRLTVEQAFAKGDEVLANAAMSLAEVIQKTFTINVDFADVNRAMKDSGCSLMGIGEATGDNRALDALKQALNSPLLNNNDVTGAKYTIVIATAHPDHAVYMDEMGDILDYITECAGGAENTRNTLKYGIGNDDSLQGDTMKVTLIMTGFATNCLDAQPKQQKSVVKIGLSGDILSNHDDDENTAPIVDFPNPEDERLARIQDQIYNQSSAPEYKKEHFNTRDLLDATSLPLAKLTEEILANLEDVPAFERRKAK